MGPRRGQSLSLQDLFSSVHLFIHGLCVKIKVIKEIIKINKNVKSNPIKINWSLKTFRNLIFNSFTNSTSRSSSLKTYAIPFHPVLTNGPDVPKNFPAIFNHFSRRLLNSQVASSRPGFEPRMTDIAIEINSGIITQGKIIPKLSIVILATPSLLPLFTLGLRRGQSLTTEQTRFYS